MIAAALFLVLGMLPSALAQFPPDCVAACGPVEAYLNSCITDYVGNPRGGLDCMANVCVGDNLGTCITCSVPVTGYPAETYYGMFGCPVPEPEPTTIPTPTPTPTPEPEPTSSSCGRPNRKNPGHNNGNGKGHDQGNGKGHDKHH